MLRAVVLGADLQHESSRGRVAPNSLSPSFFSSKSGFSLFSEGVAGPVWVDLIGRRKLQTAPPLLLELGLCHHS